MNLSTFRQWFQQVQIILFSINRQAELKRLIAWAAQKNLPGPKKCYETHLNQEQQKQLLNRKHFPKQTKLAFLLYMISNVVSSKPNYLPSGSAVQYRLHPNHK